VLFLARYSSNQVGQIRPGSTGTDKVVSLSSSAQSSGGLNFVPPGFPGAGQLKVVSYDSGKWFTVTLAPDGAGTYDVTSEKHETTIVGGPEGFIYVPPGSPQFKPYDSLLVAESDAGKISTFEIDSDGDPEPATRREFITGLTGAEGAAIDPLTGDFLFSTFGSSSHVIVVRGFAAATADLVETAVSNPPGVVVLKQKFSVTDSAHNQGAAAAGATTTRYYLSLDTLKSSADKVLGGKRAVPGLGPGDTSTGTISVTVATSTKLGIYHVLACADDLKVEAEADETNNCIASMNTVDVRAPDLVETAVSDPPATASPGGTFMVTDTANNSGNATANASTTRYYLSLDTKKSSSDSLLMGTRSVPSLTAGAMSTGTVTVTISGTIASGNYFLLACADDLKKSFESNEKNNCKAAATTVMIGPGSGSAVSIVDFFFMPSTLNVAVGTNVTWTNNGMVTHTSTSDSALWDSGFLAPGQSFSFTFSIAGTYQYHCTVHDGMMGSIVVH
jgi:plastocyanin